jgi:excisionase family DNA binding protein
MDTQERTELISVREAAQIAGVSYQTIWRLVGRGEVVAVRVGNDHGPLRIPRQEFMDWLYGEPEEAA